MMACAYGFRIVGACTERRRPIDWAVAFRAHAACDDRAEVNQESYLSAFTFGESFRDYLAKYRSTRGFDGPTCSPWLWFDIDRDDLDAARLDAARLVNVLLDRYQLHEDALLIFFSGSKGFHLGLPTGLWRPTLSETYNRVARKLAEGLASLAHVVIDRGVYDKVRAFRAPNSWHPKTGLHKRRLSLEELSFLLPDAIQQMARVPLPFDLPKPPVPHPNAIADWQEACGKVVGESEARANRRARANGVPTLNRGTMDLIRNGSALAVGERHRLLFAAAANLAEFGCPSALAHALLTDAGRDAGLPPKDVHRQIECGLGHRPGGQDHA